jgi:3' exoribonuclease, RNase T-like
MRFFFDTEMWDSGNQIVLVSIGTAAEDGRTYYAELVDRNWYVFERHEWLRLNVAPHLRGPVREREEVASEIVQFVGDNPQWWAYVADYDWVALCQLYGPLINRPTTWPWTALDTYQLPNFQRYVVRPQQPHNALSDAIALKQSWEAWRAAWPDYPLPAPA